MKRLFVIPLAIGWLVAVAGLADLHAQAKKAADNPIPAEFSKALEKAAALELYSLDPAARVAKPDAGFHGWSVLGKTQVKKEPLAKLVAALKQGAAEADQRVSAGCFRPRHGIRVQLDGKSYDFVICFECVVVMLYMDREAKSNAGFHVSRTPAKVFNTVLKDAKIKLPEQPDR
jgi:hypothetical protein